jgi:lysine biosynthesis protein LysW
MVIGACPECDADVLFTESPRLQQCVVCPRCRATLVVISLAPIELDWAFVEPLRDRYPLGFDAGQDHESGNET